MKERCKAKRGGTAMPRDVCQLFQSFKDSLEDFRVMELASEGGNVSCLGLKVKDFRLQGAGDNDTYMSVCSRDDFGESISAGHAQGRTGHLRSRGWPECGAWRSKTRAGNGHWPPQQSP